MYRTDLTAKAGLNACRAVITPLLRPAKATDRDNDINGIACAARPAGVKAARSSPLSNWRALV